MFFDGFFILDVKNVLNVKNFLNVLIFLNFWGVLFFNGVFFFSRAGRRAFFHGTTYQPVALQRSPALWPAFKRACSMPFFKM